MLKLTKKQTQKLDKLQNSIDYLIGWIDEAGVEVLLKNHYYCYVLTLEDMKYIHNYASSILNQLLSFREKECVGGNN